MCWCSTFHGAFSPSFDIVLRMVVKAFSAMLDHTQSPARICDCGRKSAEDKTLGAEVYPKLSFKLLVVSQETGSLAKGC